MSKISDYLEQMRRAQSNSTQTVAEFATSLHRPTDVLLSQLLDAGVSVDGPSSLFTEEAKVALLDHLRKAHQIDGGGRPRIHIETRSERHQRAVSGNENGAEWAALCEFAGTVIWEGPIDPKFQRLVNLIVAKAVILGSLPTSRRGRPVAEGAQEFGKELAEAFWDMRDSGVPYKTAIAALGERHHKDERHLSRIIKEHTKSVGATREERDKRRQWQTMTRQVLGEHGPSSYVSAISAILNQTPAPELTVQDCLDHLSELLQRDHSNGK